MSTGALLGKEAILAAEDMATEIVEVPEWGGSVRVKALSGAERDRFEESMMAGKGTARRFSMLNFRAKLVALCVVDSDGARVFEDGDVRALASKSAAALDRIVSVCQRLSRISEQDVEELQDAFALGQPEDSTSG